MVFHWRVEQYPVGAGAKPCIPDDDPTAPQCEAGQTRVAWRLSAISTNRGYAIKYAYAANTISTGTEETWARLVSATALNVGRDACDLLGNGDCATAPSARTVAYTVNGSVESVSNPLGDATTYTFDTAKRLTRVNLPDGGTSLITVAYNADGTVQATGGRGGTTSYTYATSGAACADGGGVFRLIDYDPIGWLRRVGPDGRTLVHAGAQLMAEYDGATLARRHVFAPGLDEPLVTYSGGSKTFHVADERGSVVAATDAAGMVVTSWGYGPHGEPDARGMPPTFGFTGALSLPQLGLTSMRARVYSHRLGRFLQPDPIGQAGGINLYDYAGGDPVNGWDPWGLLAQDVTDEPKEQILVEAPRIVGGGAGGGVGVGARSGDSRREDCWPFCGLDKISSPQISLVPTDGQRLIGIEQCNPSYPRTSTNVPSLGQLQTILNKHYHNPKPGKCIFGSWASNPTSLIIAIGEVLEGSYIEQRAGQRAYTRDLGFVVGTDQQGVSTTYMTVITHNFGSLDGFWDVANFFPGKTGR